MEAHNPKAAPGGNVMVLTVGEGTVDKLEETVVTPFRRSFEQGEWKLIVLLPSKKTEGNARLLEERFPEFPLRVRALRRGGDEDDTDACFRHFDTVLQRLKEEGYAPEQITADVTRGTKAMTAALAMTAMAHGAGRIRYITGERDERGTVKPGTERVMDVEPQRVLRRQNANRAADYLRGGNYRAVEALFREARGNEHENFLKEEVRWLVWAAEFWGAWDRFDYKEAARLGRRHGMPAEPPPMVREFLPSEKQLQMLKQLGGTAAPEADDNAGYCRALAADLLANAERRLLEGQNEEVLVRLYRVVELIGQLRLFVHGIDSGKVHPQDERVEAWMRGLPEREKPRVNRDGFLELGREKAASLLDDLEKRAGDAKGAEISGRLVKLDWMGEWGPKMRNRSLLIHGFRARSRGREKELQKLLATIQEFYLKEADGNPALLEACQFSFLRIRRSPATQQKKKENAVKVE